MKKIRSKIIFTNRLFFFSLISKIYNIDLFSELSVDRGDRSIESMMIDDVKNSFNNFRSTDRRRFDGIGIVFRLVENRLQVHHRHAQLQIERSEEDSS